MIPEDISKGISLLEEACENGSREGKYQLAIIHIYERYGYGKYEEGRMIIDKLIADGYDKAKLFLSRALIYGERIDRNVKLGIEMIEELVSRDVSSAIFEYAELLIDGVYITKDIAKGEKSLRSIYASEVPDSV